MRRLLLGVALALTGCSASVPTAPAEQQSPPAPAALPVAAGATLAPAPRQPRHFRMWRFAATVVPIPLHHGTLIPPDDPQVLGWWGKRAGAEHGTTLLVGHSVHTGGGELDALAATPIGATATVSGIPYRVGSVQVLTHRQLAKQSPNLFSQTGPARLAVVTCADYDWSLGIWTKNTVVLAKQVSTAR